MLVARSCLTLCDPMDCSLLGSSVHGILQARILEWVVIPFSKWSSWTSESLHYKQILYHLSQQRSTVVVKKKKIQLPYALLVLLLNRYAEELKTGSQRDILYTHVHMFSIVHKAKIEEQPESINRQMDRQNKCSIHTLECQSALTRK